MFTTNVVNFICTTISAIPTMSNISTHPKVNAPVAEFNGRPVPVMAFRYSAML